MNLWRCSKCEQDAVAIWPPFDRKVEPAPYCPEHLREAQQTIVLGGPRIRDMLKPKRELATV